MVGMTNPFPAGLTLLSAKMPIAAVIDVIDTSVRQPAFLPVGEVDHRGRTFTQFRQVSDLTNYLSYTGDFVRVEFVDIPDRNYPADEEVEVILGCKTSLSS